MPCTCLQRLPTCDVFCEHASISRQHAALSADLATGLMVRGGAWVSPSSTLFLLLWCTDWPGPVCFWEGSTMTEPYSCIGQGLCLCLLSCALPFLQLSDLGGQHGTKLGDIWWVAGGTGEGRRAIWEFYVQWLLADVSKLILLVKPCAASCQNAGALRLRPYVHAQAFLFVCDSCRLKPNTAKQLQKGSTFKLGASSRSYTVAGIE